MNVNGLPYTLVFFPSGSTLLFGDGSAAAPSISFASDPDTGFYRTAAGQVGFTSDGVRSLTFQTGGRILGAGATFIVMPAGGGVGIDITPIRPLQVLGATGAPGAGTGIWVGDSGAGKSALEMGRVDATRSWLQSWNNGAASVLSLNEAGGNVLVGTTVNSGALLNLGTNTTTSAGGIVFGTDTFLYRLAAGVLALDIASGSAGFYGRIAGTTQITFQYTGTQTEVISNTSALVLKSNNTTALTLDASQNATFAGLAITQIYTVATLPAAAAGNKGARAHVSNATATLTAGIGAIVAGGGANIVPVFSDGTNWRIG
jgi:hypothetical protein